MTEREEIVRSMFEGIVAAYHSTSHEGNDLLTDCMTFAETALAVLEADGFKVVRSA